ncbi:MAG: translation initiation factor IF-2 [Myxococcota bacterium]|jgi:translation initiation factor IF-2
MSTKDLLDRIQRSPSTTRTRRVASSGSEQPGTTSQKETSTRVAKGVIRRRPKRSSGAGSDQTRTNLGSGSNPNSASSAKSSTGSSNKRSDGRPPRRPLKNRKTRSLKTSSSSGNGKQSGRESATGQQGTDVSQLADETGSFKHLGLGSAVIGLPENFRPKSAEPEPVIEAAPPVVESPAPEVAPAATPVAEAAPAAEASPVVAKKVEKAEKEPAKPIDKKGPGRYKHLGLGSAVIGLPENYDPKNPSGGKTTGNQAKPARPAAGGRQPAWQNTPAAGAAGGAARGRTGAAGGGGGSGRPASRSRGRGRSRFVNTGNMPFNKRRKKGRKKGAPKKASPQAKAIKRRVTIEAETITVSELAHSMSVKASQVITVLMDEGLIVRANDSLDIETAQLIGPAFEYEIIDGRFDEDTHLIEIEEADEDLQPRDAVITIMGHVDHGKTTLLDSIRKANVAAGEAGGITQHISAYQVTREDKQLTFIDTPGHEAFTQMRARGALVTDIVVLVVAADDGVMPQTVEALNHAKAAGVQIMVAINKCDKVDANPDRVRQELMKYDLIPESYGGDTIFTEVSALKHQGIDDLLDNLLLIAEVAEFKANPDRHAEGYVLEARLERGRGAVATLLVKHGTLKQGQRVVLGTTWGRVRAMSDFRGKRLKEAGPSTPVEIIGLQDVPSAGDQFSVVNSDKDAKALAENRMLEEKERLESANSGPMTLEKLMQMRSAEELLTLNLIIRSDVGGTLEAMDASLKKINVDGTAIKVLHSGIGAITEGDITLAHTYNGIIIGFNVRPDSKARRSMNELGVEARLYKVIYEALEDVTKALKGMLEPELKETWKGFAEIRQTFGVPKIGTVAGCMVTDGAISRNHRVRLLRNSIVIWEGKLASLRRFKDDVRTVEKGYECGMNLDGYNDIKIGDVIETHMMEEVAID